MEHALFCCRNFKQLRTQLIDLFLPNTDMPVASKLQLLLGGCDPAITVPEVKFIMENLMNLYPIK